MPNGKPGDHPLTDILAHGAEVYGRSGRLDPQDRPPVQPARARVVGARDMNVNDLEVFLEAASHSGPAER
jgi:hypothetical protein